MFDDSRSRDNSREEGTSGGLPPLLPERLLPVAWADSSAAYTSLLQGLGDGIVSSVRLIDSPHQVAIEYSSGAFIKYDTPQEFFTELKGALLYPFHKREQFVTQAALPVILDNHQIFEVQCRLNEIQHGDWKIYKLTGPIRSNKSGPITTASRDPEEFLRQVEQLLKESSVSHIRDASSSLTRGGEIPIVEIGVVEKKQQMQEIIHHLEHRLKPVWLIPYPIGFDFSSTPHEQFDELLKHEGPWKVLVKYGDSPFSSDL